MTRQTASLPSTLRPGKTRLYIAALVTIMAFVENGLQTGLTARLHAQQQQPPAQPQRRLFPPIDLGLLESPDRAEWQRPEQIMDLLHIADGSTVADIGAGAGWFTIRLARRVGPNGIVYSQDVQREMLEAIRRRVSREGLQNVRTRLSPCVTPERRCVTPERPVSAAPRCRRRGRPRRASHAASPARAAGESER